MSAAASPSASDPAVAGGAVPDGVSVAGQRLLGVVQRMMGTGLAMARHVNRIARQRLEGQPLSRLGPPGFNPTAVSALLVEALAWTAALRERLLALTRPSFAHAAGPAGAPRPRQGRSAASFLPETLPNPTEDDWHDYWELAKPVRLGPSGVAAATQLIAGLSHRAVADGISDMLSQASVQMGAEADATYMTGMETEARTLCAELEAAEQAADAAKAAAMEAPTAIAADPPAAADGAPVVQAAAPFEAPADAPQAAVADAAEDDPPPEPPDKSGSA